ncbi:sulfite exporter TauE/SafE family protein, partial [Candidatus Woesearchaeota archaeon]|nr:sulfite exporter TauE/SafE family protein [Candidatus Woesearchaeota archaeon]
IIKKESSSSFVGWFILLIGLIAAGIYIFNLSGIQLPEVGQNIGYGLLFVIGLLTGFHCIAMCGGFVVSYTAKGAQQGKKPHKMHLSYAFGKTLSYTVIGAIFGFLGSIIAFTPVIRGFVGIFAGIFLMIFGLKMLNIFPSLRKFQWRWPSFIEKFVSTEAHHHHSPLIIGLLNGLMIACGPLQAMYILAAGTGSVSEGAKMLFIFGLGTLPVMLGFGYFASFVGSKATYKILKFSGVFILILGLIMLNRGLALTGSGYDFNSLTSGLSETFTPTSDSGNDAAKNTFTIKDGYQEIRMDVKYSGWSPNKFILQKNVPVKWIIDGKELNGCNSAIVVPKLGLNFKIKPGEQVIEFTPTETGSISWSCAMGMLQGLFIVQEQVDTATVSQDLNKAKVPTGGSCSMGGGGCGCGAAR